MDDDVTYKDELIAQLKDALAEYERETVVVIESMNIIDLIEAQFDGVEERFWDELRRNSAISQAWEFEANDIYAIQRWPGLRRGDVFISFKDKDARIQFKLTYGF